MHFLDRYDNPVYRRAYELQVEDKMKRQRQKKLKFFSTIVRQDLAEDFAKILAAAYLYGSPEAEKIIAKFDLDQSDFFAITGNLENYKKEYERKEMEKIFSSI